MVRYPTCFYVHKYWQCPAKSNRHNLGTIKPSTSSLKSSSTPPPTKQPPTTSPSFIDLKSTPPSYDFANLYGVIQVVPLALIRFSMSVTTVYQKRGTRIWGRDRLELVSGDWQIRSWRSSVCPSSLSPHPNSALNNIPHPIEASRDMAKQYGPYSLFQGSPASEKVRRGCSLICGVLHRRGCGNGRDWKRGLLWLGWGIVFWWHRCWQGVRIRFWGILSVLSHILGGFTFSLRYPLLIIGS